LPCSARSGTPGRSLRNASNRKRTCLQVDTKMMVLACGGGSSRSLSPQQPLAEKS
jgi:hypothetical protein